MNLIVRNALSPWQAGFQNNRTTFRPAALRGPMPVIRMGQTGAPITQAQRDQTLAALNDAWQKGQAMDTYKANNPDWQLAMQKDADQFLSLQSSAAPLLATATKVRQNLAIADAASWTVTQSEISDANSWATAVSGMYGLMSKHSTSLAPVNPPPTGVTPPPGGGVPNPTAKTDYTIPIAIGAGVLVLGIIFWKSRSGK